MNTSTAEYSDPYKKCNFSFVHHFDVICMVFSDSNSKKKAIAEGFLLDDPVDQKCIQFPPKTSKIFK